MRISDFSKLNQFGGGMNGLFGSTGSQNFMGNAALYKGFSEVNSIGYKRMLKKYFAEVEGSKTEDGKDKDTIDKWEEMQKDEKSSANAKLVKELKDASGSLKSAADTLTAVDKDNKNILFGKDRETIDKAIMSFAREYNDLVKDVAKNSFSNNKVASLLNQLSSISKSSQYALRDAGVTVNRDGTLTVDEEKLASADLGKLEQIFGGKKNSFAARVGEKAEYVMKNTDRYKDDSYSSYTKNLDYNNVFGSGGLYNNFF